MTVQGSRSFVTISLVGFAAGLVVAFALGAGFGATALLVP